MNGGLKSIFGPQNKKNKKISWFSPNFSPIFSPILVALRNWPQFVNQQSQHKTEISFGKLKTVAIILYGKNAKILPSLWNIGYKRKYYQIAPRGVCETLFTHRHFDYSSKNIFWKKNCTILKPNTVLQTELQRKEIFEV